MGNSNNHDQQTQHRHELKMQGLEFQDREKAHRWHLDILFLKAQFILSSGGLAVTASLAGELAATQEPVNGQSALCNPAVLGVTGFALALAATLVCAVQRRHSLAGANPARQLSLQPVAIGAGYGGNDMA